MAYFEDLSDYTYHNSFFYRPNTRNVGWLGLGHDFPKLTPSEETLDLVWEHCKISIAQMRGIHHCEFCAGPPPQIYAVRNGLKLSLGSSEIRVLSKDGYIYAAPSLICHYIRSHHYKPPDEFLHALVEGVRPQNPKYFALLDELGLEWQKKSHVKVQPKAFKFEKIDGEERRVELDLPTHVDED